ncbi:MAG: hypothetical protein PHG35_03445 [Dehalococcoidales bacterium]|nr:hypothetical protein [Dehalococcoidales bacterium]
MNEKLILSIFPGIDLLGMAFEEAGYCVVRGPDLLWGGDIHKFHPPTGAFEGIIGGPPCVGETPLANFNSNKGYTLWPEAMRVINEAQPEWWMLEAVIRHDAPYFVCLSPRWIGEKQSRKRYFHSNLDITRFIEVSLFENPIKEPCVKATELAKGFRPLKIKKEPYYPHRPWELLCELQGLSPDFDIKPFTKAWKGIVLGNAVPLSMGREIAKAITKAREVSMEKVSIP